MAGVGSAPKDPSKRARRNKDPIGTTVLTFVPGEQPFLPADYDWAPQTIDWWRLWREAELSRTFTALDWSFLLDTAVLHTRFWTGDMKAAPELRLRVAKFGMTPEDRARLRITFADADEKDAKRNERGTSQQPEKGSTYGNVRAIRPPS
jgi:hypothetical protein